MKIGILQTGLAPTELVSETGEYPDMFAKLLADEGFEFDTYSVVQNQFPSGADAADGWLITGSKHGVYEDHDWIPPLEDLIRDAYARDIPMVGVCFGHQIIAQALGGKVEKFAGGWAVGPTEYDMPEGKMRIHAWHQDQVVQTPPEAKVVGRNDFCENAALLYGHKAYTVQPHPEFGDTFVSGLIDTRGRGVVPDTQLDAAKQELGQTLDSARMAKQFARFFRGEEPFS
ncbi:MAG: type 1 glutamine amidotransferase [Thalassococcus sp.]|uniref:type 1 glutamine amidotransferase n=1 Tax=Thalassococcus sp. TaxID=1928858 RepID=UPI001B125649|nr:type 1 glutamine amidotransferase [Thalassococcus sp.]MBO6868044.1 type 1 glutamine amidotransferase [Thalassococcus sp.]